MVAEEREATRTLSVQALIDIWGCQTKGEMAGEGWRPRTWFAMFEEFMSNPVGDVERRVRGGRQIRDTDSPGSKWCDGMEVASSTGRKRKARGLRTKEGKHQHGLHGEKKKNPKKEKRESETQKEKSFRSQGERKYQEEKGDQQCK